jgi:hypothetical protein
VPGNSIPCGENSGMSLIFRFEMRTEGGKGDYPGFYRWTLVYVIRDSIAFCSCSFDLLN